MRFRVNEASLVFGSSETSRIAETADSAISSSPPPSSTAALIASTTIRPICSAPVPISADEQRGHADAEHDARDQLQRLRAALAVGGAEADHGRDRGERRPPVGQQQDGRVPGGGRGESGLQDHPAATNTAPVVNAGADQTITLPATASLNATVTDDGSRIPGGGDDDLVQGQRAGDGDVRQRQRQGDDRDVLDVGQLHVATDGQRQRAVGQRRHRGDGQSAATGPCAGLCTSPTNFSINGSFQSGNLGTGAVCYQTTSVVHGGTVATSSAPAR